MITRIVYIANDGTQWYTIYEAKARDVLHAKVQALEAMLPPSPKADRDRVAFAEQDMLRVKALVMALVHEEHPCEEIFTKDAVEVHPMSWAGRILSEWGGPLNRIWWRFATWHDGYFHSQPFFALNPGEWERQFGQKAAAK